MASTASPCPPNRSRRQRLRILPIERRCFQPCHLAVQLVRRESRLISLVFIVGQRLLDRTLAGETAVDRYGEQFGIAEGIAHALSQNRIFAVTCVPNQCPARLRGATEKVGEIPRS